MKKLYGYKEKDVVKLAKTLSESKNEPLCKTFERFAAETGKARGTVRNLYYALAKTSASDEEFTAKYLGGKKIAVSKIKEFDEQSEKDLVFGVLELKNKGYSVRGAVYKLAAGDAKLALRYQNKYRNIAKRNPQMIENALISIGGDIPINNKKPTEKKPFAVPDYLIARLKKDIDGLIGKISAKIREENEYLKKRAAFLETENLRLSNLLFSGEKRGAADYFIKTEKKFVN